MTPLQYLKKIIATLPDLARQNGCSTARMYVAFIRCFICNHVQLEEFQASHMYEFSGLKMSGFLTERRRAKLAPVFNAGATAEDFADFNEKHRFNAVYHEFVHRDWLYLPDASEEEIRSFVARNPAFLTKADALTQGKGIDYHSRRGSDVNAFFRQLANRPVLLESFIKQHPAMAALNPSSVNTVRIVSARRGGRVILLGACLRVGGEGSYLDNFHKGGVAYPLDIETGVVSGRGRTLQGQAVYLRHPSTGHIMPGFQIPHWDTLKQEVCRAALISPHIGYVGWDIAVTTAGVEFIEGNVNSPDPIVIQLDDNGVYTRIKQFLRETE